MMKPGARAKMLLGTGKGFRKVRSFRELKPDHEGRKARVEWPKVLEDGNSRMVLRDATLLRWRRGAIRVRLDSGAEVDFTKLESVVVERLRRRSTAPSREGTPSTDT